MTSQSVEQAVRSAIKLEIGDDENITFKQKNILGQKFGLTPVVLVEDDKIWLDLEEYHAGE